MKLPLSFLLSLALLGHSFGGVISSQEASNHIGESVTMPELSSTNAAETVRESSASESETSGAVAFDRKANAQLLEGRIAFPRDTFHVDFLAAAQDKARSQKKPIAIILTDKDTTCGLCLRATGLMADSLRSRAVLVYARNSESLPKAVASEFSARGKYIPKVVLFDAELEEFYGLVTYEEVKAEGDRPLRALKRKS
jgi:hypothetical protein